MTVSAFEMIGNESFRIGDRVVSCHFSDQPSNGKYRYYADVTSDERDKICQHLFVHDFRDVYPSDLPNGISINIQSPRSDFRQVSYAEITKVNDKSELTIVICFDFLDWHLPINLVSFAERYRDALLCRVDGALRCHIDQSEPGLFVVCSTSVTPDQNYLSSYRAVVRQALSTYRKCLENIYQQPASEGVAPPQVTDTVGARWWVRYVVVPILGSGAVAAIAAGLISILK
jgi:hypothetical protein